MHPVAKAAFKPIPIQKGHEKLKVFFFSIVWCCRHQQKMACKGGQQLAKLVTLGILDLAPEEGGRKFVRFIADDQIPEAVGCFQFLLDIFIT